VAAFVISSVALSGSSTPAPSHHATPARTSTR
jgi:hypothetical protein